MRNVIVTGGSRGLGLGIAQRLAGAGYQVIAIARQSNDQLRCAMDKADAARPGSFRFKSFDLAETDKIPELVRDIKKECGTIYGLVNNAALGFDGVLATMHNTQIERLIRVNTLSPIILSKYVVRS